MVSVCPTCNKNVTKSSGGVSCCICEQWFHLKKCSGLADGAYDILTKKNGAVGWKCGGCSSFVVVGREYAIDNLTKKLDDLISGLPDIVRREVDKSLPPILKAVEDNKNKCLDMNSAAVSKINSLEAESNRLRHQLSRSDILVSGLPPNVKPTEMAIKIPAAVGVKLDASDINASFWLGRQKKIMLIKFNSTAKRDEIMRNYMVRKNLKHSSVFPTDIDARIYLNDNLSPAALKVKMLCRSLQKDKKIKRFELIPSAAKAVIFDVNGTRKVCTHAELSALDNEAESNFIRSQRGRRSDRHISSQPENYTPTFGTPNLVN